MNSYIVGNLVHISVVFTTTAGAAIDPTVVKCLVRTPAGVTTTYTYGTDAALVKAAVGSYYLDVDANAEGIWNYRWYSTGTGQAADDGVFAISDSVFV
jgi:hypothetical protein